MKYIESSLLLGTNEEPLWRRVLIDTLLGLGGALCVTGIITLLQLYPKIPNISLLYLLIVLGLASTRGLYAAIIASIAAFLSFDYFLVVPLYTFTVGKLEEWLALFIFLITAIITGQLASALRRRAEQAMQKERETRALYELVNATTKEESLELQLNIIARTIVDVFSFAGVYDCAILLPDEHGKLLLLADARYPIDQVRLSSDEEKTASLVLTQGQIVDLYMDAPPASPAQAVPYRFRRVVAQRSSAGQYVRIIPLHIGQRAVGVVRLRMEKKEQQLALEHVPKDGRIRSQAAFFWVFLDQAASLIDRARLHRESVQVELLRRTDMLRSALLSSVSHDLRTPLASIKAAASSLLQDDVQWSEAERSSFVGAIEREADRLNRLVGNLLDMSRIEGGALKPEKEWYPIDELINDVLSHIQGQLQRREVRTSIPDDLPPVELDYLQIDQVLTNLVENALRYTPAASPIEIAVEANEQEMLIRVADSGPGIPPQDLERVFDKFYRVLNEKNKTNTMGTGLGLAVCRGLIEAHGGRIWAENRTEGGAIFRFTLPLKKGGNGDS